MYKKIVITLSIAISQYSLVQGAQPLEVSVLKLNHTDPTGKFAQLNLDDQDNPISISTSKKSTPIPIKFDNPQCINQVNQPTCYRIALVSNKKGCPFSILLNNQIYNITRMTQKSKSSILQYESITLQPRPTIHQSTIGCEVILADGQDSYRTQGVKINDTLIGVKEFPTEEINKLITEMERKKKDHGHGANLEIFIGGTWYRVDKIQDLRSQIPRNQANVTPSTQHDHINQKRNSDKKKKDDSQSSWNKPLLIFGCLSVTLIAYLLYFRKK